MFGNDPAKPVRLSRGALHRWGWVVALSVLLCGTAPVSAKPAAPQVAAVALTQLPEEARQTHRLILKGGPFPYTRDGTVFGNRERLLPPRPRGEYREYTVRTPGTKDRGARRIVCGGLPPDRPQQCFFTDDHYSSFKRIEP